MTGSGGAGGSMTGTGGAGGSMTGTGGAGGSMAGTGGTMTGAGGAGGTMTGTGGMMGTGGSMTGTGGSMGTGGSGPTGTVLLVAGGSASSLGGEFHPQSGWMTTPFNNEATNDGPSIALNNAGGAVAVLRAASGDALRFATWTSSGFSAWAPVGASARAMPWVVGSGGRHALIYQGADYKHYYGGYTGGWLPSNDPVGGGGSQQSYGPTPATMAALGTSDVAVFAGGNGDLYDQTRTGGSWQSAHGHGLGDVVLVTPTIVALNGGSADLMIVFIRKSDAKIMFTTRTGTTWAAPAQVDPNSYSNDPVGVTALPNGGALIGFRGLDGKVYWSRYAAGAWSTPAPLASPNPTTPSTPALAAGVGGVDAEMVFVENGAAYHARLSGMAWSAPVLVGGSGIVGVAISSAP